MDDREIVALVVEGRTSEYRRLVERYQQPVFRFACNLIGNRHDAEDITQEVFVAAFDNLRSYDSRRSSLLTWLLAICRNRCINCWKRKRPATTGESFAAADLLNPEDDSIRREFWEELDAALISLPIDQKTAFILAEIEGLPYADIAVIEGTSLGTVKSRLHRAKQKLRQLLETHVKEP
ncbi:MAG: sigma-70 family RNA polymerase sigma factor [Planctomycetaceae bacterium]|nr:sigma-70 family RNA polymerase sigma factor [Planctomycetales bacterium]MCB9921950.1 sigma-70 family RNA polymerase sigma factor [Planctomycetaceae bacterium]